MKICITSQGDNLEAQVEPRFGRSPYFIIYDTENSSFEAMKNPNVSASGGAGIQSAQLMIERDVTIVLTGQLGVKAAQALEEAKIKISTNIAGTVKETLDKYLNAGTETSVQVVSGGGQAGSWLRRCMRRWFGRGRAYRGRGCGCRGRRR